MSICESETGKQLSVLDVEELYLQLELIENCRKTIAEIQGYHETYSIDRVCAPAQDIVNQNLDKINGERIDYW